jgi:thiamine-monophosphate kinase
VWFEQLPLSDALAPLVNDAAAQDCILAGGDDYELVFTAPPNRRESIAAIAETLGMRLTRVGHILPAAGLRILDRGEPMAIARAGFDHFQP